MAFEKAHSDLGASNYYRWGKCPGSVRLSKSLARLTNHHAERGNAAHETAYKILTSKPYEDLDPEDMEAIDVYVSFIRSRIQADRYIAFEKKIDLTKYHPELYGTADCLIYDPPTKTITVVDYKHGLSVVEVEENPQLMYYALGAIHESQHPISHVELVIVQPRAFHKMGPVRIWTTDLNQMLEFASELKDKAKRTESVDAPLVTGDHCRYCPALAVCPEKQKSAVKCVEQANVPYDPKKLSDALNMVSQLEDWLKGLKEFALNEALDGRIPPGYKLEPKRAMRRWRKDADAFSIADAFQLPSNLMVETKLKSPADIEKMLPKTARPFLEEFTEKISSGFNLVEGSDEKKA